jgi:hypothetical protein
MSARGARITIVRPANPAAVSPDVGKADATVVLAVRGETGAVALEIASGWFLPKALAGIETLDITEFPEAVVGFHSHTPMDSAVHHTPKCPVLDGGPCWGESSSVAGRHVLRALLLEGDVAAWRELEAFYAAAFHRGDGPSYLDELRKKGRTIKYGGPR